MDEPSKMRLKADITGMKGMNMNFKSNIGIPPPTLLAGMPPMPLQIHPALLMYLNALQSHSDEFAKLLKLVDEIIDQI